MSVCCHHDKKYIRLNIKYIFLRLAQDLGSGRANCLCAFATATAPKRRSAMTLLLLVSMVIFKNFFERNFLSKKLVHTFVVPPPLISVSLFCVHARLKKSTCYSPLPRKDRYSPRISEPLKIRFTAQRNFIQIFSTCIFYPDDDDVVKIRYLSYYVVVITTKDYDAYYQA